MLGGGFYARFIAWVLELLHRRIHHPHVNNINGVQIQVCPQVFNPIVGRTTRFFLRNIRIPPNRSVLEIGTGTGAIAAAAAKNQAKYVIATDISHQAVACAKATMALNGVEDRVKILQGDLFNPVPNEKFDAILFNPPYLALLATSHIARAWCAGPQCELITRFLAEAPKYLARDGNIQVLFTSAAPFPKLVGIIRKQKFQIQLQAKGRLLGFFETIYFLRLKKSDINPPIEVGHV